MKPLDATLAAIEGVILGKATQVRLCLACLLARGHLLLEDVPGVGKTTLAQTLARVLGLEWARLQFTSDMLPADIVGVSIFDRSTQKFQFRRGPVFTQLLLADEINRASPKAQSALLEAMAERQVSIDGVTYALPEPFFVVATQNPHEQIGTYGLPESQLDRFLMRVTQRAAHDVHVSDTLLDYLQALVARTRAQLRLGLSPRAAQGLMRAAQALALIDGEDAVLPEHIQIVFPAIAAHRLVARDGDATERGAEIADELIRATPVPV